MGLALSKPSNEFIKGAYIDEVEILSAVDMSGIENQWGNKNDLAIEFEFKITGRDFTTKQTIGGNLKREGEAVTGWGGAFAIENIVTQSGYFKTIKPVEQEEFLSFLEMGRVPSNFLLFLKGKKVFRISYVSGVKEADPTKLKYSAFNQIGFNKDILMKSFKNGLQKGYPKTYAPDTVPAPAGDAYESTDGDASFVPEAMEEDVF